MGCCECGELSDSIKGGKFLNKLSDFMALFLIKRRNKFVFILFGSNSNREM
jgi:hypothetical protein